jgi:hypothetical protein
MQRFLRGLAVLALWTSTVRGDVGGNTVSPPQGSRLRKACAPNDGPAVSLAINVSSCSFVPTASALTFLIWGPDLAGLHAGTALPVGPGPNATTQAARTLPTGRGVLHATKGSLLFTTLSQNGRATGSYDLTYEDHTTEQGRFDALWCPGGGGCG